MIEVLTLKRRSSGRARQAGFTIVETIMASVLTVMVVGVLVSLYHLVATRTLRSYSESLAVWQASRVADEMSLHIANAVNVSLNTLAGRDALKCTMPATGKFLSGSGRYDLYEADSVIGLSKEKYNSGDRVWFFFGDAAGNPSATGTLIHRAVRTDDSNPTASNVDWAWERYPGKTTTKYPLVGSMSLVVENTYETMTITVNASTESHAERQASATTAQSNRYDVSISRLVAARNARL